MEKKLWSSIVDAIPEHSRKWKRLLAKVEGYAGSSMLKAHYETRKHSNLRAKIDKETLEFSGLMSGDKEFKVTIKLKSEQKDPDILILEVLDFLDKEKRKDFAVKAYESNGREITLQEENYKEALRALEVSIARFLFRDDMAFALDDQSGETKGILRKEFIERLIAKDADEGKMELLKRFYQAQINFFDLIEDDIKRDLGDETAKANLEKRSVIIKLLVSLMLVAAVVALSYVVVIFFPAIVAVIGTIAAAAASVVSAIGLVWVVVYGVAGIYLGFKNLIKGFFKSATYKSSEIAGLKSEVNLAKEKLSEEIKEVEALIDASLKGNPVNLKIEKSKDTGLIFKSVGFMVLGQYLKLGKLSNCKTIDISGCGSLGEGIETFAEALRIQTKTSQIKLENIDLIGNDIGVKGVQAIIDALKANVTVTDIKFDTEFTRRDSNGALIEGVKESFSQDVLIRQLAINSYLRGVSFEDIQTKFSAGTNLFSDEGSLKKDALEKISNNFNITYIPFKVASNVQRDINGILEQNRLMQGVSTADGKEVRKRKLKNILSINPKRFLIFIENHSEFKDDYEEIKEEDLSAQRFYASSSVGLLDDGLSPMDQLTDVLITNLLASESVNRENVDKFFNICSEINFEELVSDEIDLAKLREFVRFDVYNEKKEIACGRLKDLPEANRIALLEMFFKGEVEAKNKALLVSKMIELDLPELKDELYYSFIAGLIGGGIESYYDSYKSLRDKLEKQRWDALVADKQELADGIDKVLQFAYQKIAKKEKGKEISRISSDSVAPGMEMLFEVSGVSQVTFLDNNYDLRHFHAEEELRQPYETYIYTRNNIYDYMRLAEERGGLSERQLDNFISLYKKFSGVDLEKFFKESKTQEFGPATVLKMIEQDVGIRGRFHGFTFKGCSKLRGLLGYNREAFVDLLAFGFKVNESDEDAKKKAKLISGLLSNPVLLESEPQNPQEKVRLEKLIYWSIVPDKRDGSPFYTLSMLEKELKKEPSLYPISGLADGAVMDSGAGKGMR